MDFLELARKRFSVVEYERREVEPEKLDKILQAGLSAPTACNNQPQKIRVIEDEEDRQKISKLTSCKYFFPLALLVCCDRTQCWKRPFDGKESGDIDAAIVTTHMMLEATDLGLGSIWVMSWDPALMKKEFALPDHIEPISLLILGYPAKNASPRKGHFMTKELREMIL